jgi:hypothetical protein
MQSAPGLSPEQIAEVYNGTGISRRNFGVHYKLAGSSGWQ